MNNEELIPTMLGKTFSSVRQIEDDRLVFENDEEVYTFYHQQDCCEYVRIEDIVGDLVDLIGSPLLEAEASSSEEGTGSDSSTWTFYKFGTIKGHVNIRWLGESNGYYSERVDVSYKKKETTGKEN